MSNDKKGKLVYLFPDKVGECSQELYDTAIWLVDSVNAEVGGHIDRSPIEGGVCILWQGSTKVLEVNISENGQNVAFEGRDTSDAHEIVGHSPITSNFAFLGYWMRETP